MNKPMRLVVTSDLLRVDDQSRNKFRNPQRTNINTIDRLICPIVSEAIPGIETEVLAGDEDVTHSIRTDFFARYGLPMDSSSWAHIYDGTALGTDCFDLFDPYFEDCFVLGFECPPYLTKYFNDRDIPFIDLSIHPVRFLPDYMFGVRSNRSSIQKKINQYRIDDRSISNVARISSARTSRVFSAEHIGESSAIFFGQVDVDASLIKNGRIAGEEEIRGALESLASRHDAVYFKPHPHSKSIPALKKMVGGIRGCHWIEVNAYDALAHSKFVTVASLSSSVLHEAKYFQKPSIERILETTSDFDTELSSMPYQPILRHAVTSEFWHFLFGDQETSPEAPDISAYGESPLKFIINMRWGR